MDAAYLKLNVYDALTEAMSAMAAKIPEDKVEFLGQYLLQYVERKKVKEMKLSEYKVAETKYEEEVAQQTQDQIVADGLKLEQQAKVDKLTNFLDIINLGSSVSTKDDMMAQVTDFILKYINASAVYIALKKTVGDNEYLYYKAYSPYDSNLAGKKLQKVTYDESDEDIPVRQGISFDAFIVPEVPEEDDDNDEDDESKPKLPPPKPQPLIVENVMREKKVHFFGIPQLGSYVAVPFSYQSFDHELGCVPKSKEEEEEEKNQKTLDDNEDDEDNESIQKPKETTVFSTVPNVENIIKFSESKISQDFIIGFDSIGNYRQFSATEIDIVKQIGEALVHVFELKEQQLVETQKLVLTYQIRGDVVVKATIDAMKVAENDYLTAPPVSVTESEQTTLAPITTDSVETKQVRRNAGENEDESTEMDGNDNGGDEVDPDAQTTENVEVVPPPESLKPYQDSVAILAIWNKCLDNENINALFQSLISSVLPLSQSTTKLIYAILLFLQYQPKSANDQFGDLTFEAVKYLINDMLYYMKIYDPMARSTTTAGTFSKMKAYIDDNNIFDITILPSYLPILQILVIWLQKAMTARENAIAYYHDVNEADLEVADL